MPPVIPLSLPILASERQKFRRQGHRVASIFRAATAVLLVALVALPGEWHALAVVPAACSKPALPRRQTVAVAIGVGLGAGLGPTASANAFFGFFETKYVNYTMGGAFNVSFPEEFAVIQDPFAGSTEAADPRINETFWRGEKIQPNEIMYASNKVVRFSRLSEVFKTDNLTQIGLQRQAFTWQGPSRLIEAIADPQNNSLDMYQFIFENERLKEYQLFAMIRRGSDNILCNVVLRTPPLLWEAREEVFKKTLASFLPLEPQLPVDLPQEKATAMPQNRDVPLVRYPTKEEVDEAEAKINQQILDNAQQKTVQTQVAEMSAASKL